MRPKNTMSVVPSEYMRPKTYFLTFINKKCHLSALLCFPAQGITNSKPNFILGLIALLTRKSFFSHMGFWDAYSLMGRIKAHGTYVLSENMRPKNPYGKRHTALLEPFFQ